jgi:hypothetical protein
MLLRRGVWTHRPILLNQEGFDLVCTSREEPSHLMRVQVKGRWATDSGSPTIRSERLNDFGYLSFHYYPKMGYASGLVALGMRQRSSSAGERGAAGASVPIRPGGGHGNLQPRHRPEQQAPAERAGVGGMAVTCRGRPECWLRGNPSRRWDRPGASARRSGEIVLEPLPPGQVVGKVTVYYQFTQYRDPKPTLMMRAMWLIANT